MLLLLTLALAAGEPAQTPPTAVRVAAAADLAFAFKDVAAAFEKQTGQKVEFSFGSTGLLAKQIQEGAPFDVFAAANVSFVDDVVKAGACDGVTKADYAVGRIAMWTSHQAGVTPPASLEDLADKRFKKIAIANPEHAPYGRAAQDALTQAGVWEKVKPKLVFGENVQQTLQFAQTGNVETAIVSLSLTVVTSGGTQTIIDADKHKPIRQALVVCGSGAKKDAGKAFAEFVNSESGRLIMRRYGFLLPSETALAAAEQKSLP